jgi:hypothetical protein
MLSIVNFWIRLGDPFRPTRLRPDSVFQNDFIWIWILHESCNSVHIDEYGFLNCMISISKAQDIPVWKSSVKVENPTARRIPARVFALKIDSPAVVILLPVVLRSNSQSYQDARHCQSLNQIRRPIWTNQIATRFCFSKRFYLTLNLSWKL